MQASRPSILPIDELHIDRYCLLDFLSDVWGGVVTANLLLIYMTIYAYTYIRPSIYAPDCQGFLYIPESTIIGLCYAVGEYVTARRKKPRESGARGRGGV